MIFLAVTLGFFAESYREHLGDRSKEKEYYALYGKRLAKRHHRYEYTNPCT